VNFTTELAPAGSCDVISHSRAFSVPSFITNHGSSFGESVEHEDPTTLSTAKWILGQSVHIVITHIPLSLKWNTPVTFLYCLEETFQNTKSATPNLQGCYRLSCLLSIVAPVLQRLITFAVRVLFRLLLLRQMPLIVRDDLAHVSNVLLLIFLRILRGILLQDLNYLAATDQNVRYKENPVQKMLYLS